MKDRPLIIGLLFGLVVISVIGAVSALVKINSLSEDYKKELSKNMDIQRTIEIVKVEKESVDKENDSLKQDNSKLRQDIAELKLQLEALKAELAELKGTNAKLELSLQSEMAQREQMAKVEFDNESEILDLEAEDEILEEIE